MRTVGMCNRIHPGMRCGRFVAKSEARRPSRMHSAVIITIMIGLMFFPANSSAASPATSSGTTSSQTISQERQFDHLLPPVPSTLVVKTRRHGNKSIRIHPLLTIRGGSSATSADVQRRGTPWARATTPQQSAASANVESFATNGKAQESPASGSVTAVEKQPQQSSTNAVVTANTSPSTDTTQKDTTDDREDPRILMLIRVLFLLYYGSLGSLMPFLPVYYHSLGHGGQIIGMLGAVKPFTTFLVAPIWGAISDGSRNPFLILKLTFLVSLVGQLFVVLSHDYLYITFMVFLTALFNAPVKSLLDSMVMDHLHHRSTYGRLRLWGQLGFGLGSSGVGYLLSKSKDVSWKDSAASLSESFEQSLLKYPALLQKIIRLAHTSWRALTGYKLAFFTYAALSLPTWLCIKAFERLDSETKINHDATASDNTTTKAENDKSVADDSEKAPSTSVSHGLLLVLRNPDALLFFFLVLMVGISSGAIENFAYVRIREVGGTGKEMGISRLVSSLAGAPMFWFSGPLSKLLGVDRILVVSLLNYVLRFLIYASMRNPYHGLPAEALRGLTFAAFWSSCTIYAHKVSPPGLHATMLMLVNAMYGGLGQSLGAIFGGKLQQAVGTVNTFYYAALSDFILVCGVVAYLGVRSASSFRNPLPLQDTIKEQADQGNEAKSAET